MIWKKLILVLYVYNDSLKCFVQFLRILKVFSIGRFIKKNFIYVFFSRTPAKIKINKSPLHLRKITNFV